MIICRIKAKNYLFLYKMLEIKKNKKIKEKNQANKLLNNSFNQKKNNLINYQQINKWLSQYCNF